jgi:hypothetical protein
MTFQKISHDLLHFSPLYRVNLIIQRKHFYTINFQILILNSNTMLKKSVLTSILILSMIGLFAQKSITSGIPLIGSTAPSFTAQSTNGEISFPGGSVSAWKVLSHPRDFTPVCSSELLELAQKRKTLKSWE